MTFGEHLDRRYEEGIVNATERLNKLLVLLAEQGRVDEAVKAASDESFQKLLLKEFGLA